MLRGVSSCCLLNVLISRTKRKTSLMVNKVACSALKICLSLGERNVLKIHASSQRLLLGKG